MNEEFKTMQEAYSYLYLIENKLRTYIQEQMEIEYGHHWYQLAPRRVLKRPPSKPFDQLLFHEYSKYCRTYPAFNYLPEVFFHHLLSLYPIRNKVAHCKCLTGEELTTLVSSVERLNKMMVSGNWKSENSLVKN